MDRYRKRPVEVLAVQWTGQNEDEIHKTLGRWARGFQGEGKGHLTFHVEKGGSTATLRVGDWVIQEPDGVGFYPCVRSEFERVYEPVSSDT